MTYTFWIQMVSYALMIGLSAGRILTKVGYLEKKLDALADFSERITVAEQSAKSAHHRIDGLEEIPVRRKKAR